MEEKQEEIQENIAKKRKRATKKYGDKRTFNFFDEEAMLQMYLLANSKAPSNFSAPSAQSGIDSITKLGEEVVVLDEVADKPEEIPENIAITKRGRKTKKSDAQSGTDSVPKLDEVVLVDQVVDEPEKIQENIAKKRNRAKKTSGDKRAINFVDGTAMLQMYHNKAPPNVSPPSAQSGIESSPKSDEVVILDEVVVRPEEIQENIEKKRRRTTKKSGDVDPIIFLHDTAKLRVCKGPSNPRGQYKRWLDKTNFLQLLYRANLPKACRGSLTTNRENANFHGSLMKSNNENVMFTGYSRLDVERDKPTSAMLTDDAASATTNQQLDEQN